MVNVECSYLLKCLIMCILCLHCYQAHNKLGELSLIVDLSGLSCTGRHIRWFWRLISCFTGGSCRWLLRQRHLDTSADSACLFWSSEFAQMTLLRILLINIRAVVVVWSSTLYCVVPQLCSVISTFAWAFLTVELGPVGLDLCFCLIFMVFTRCIECIAY